MGRAVAKADAQSGDYKPKIADNSSKDGRQLVGTRGMGCVNCHGMLGVKSLGMPAPELTYEHDRLRPHQRRDAERDPDSAERRAWAHEPIPRR